MSVSTDLRASGELIKLLERAKSESEFTLDDFPGLFGVVDSTGTLYKGNRNLARLLSLPHERLVGQKISKIFSRIDWRTFSEKMGLAIKSEKSSQFEMSSTDESSKLSYTWQVRTFGETHQKTMLFAVVGTDVTEIKALTYSNTRMEMELNTANRLQEMMLPSLDHQSKSIDLTGLYYSASECGGDWWYYAEQNGKFIFWIGDVTGHGVSAALLTTFARSAVTVLLRQGQWDLKKSIVILNDLIFEIAKREKLMTCFAAEIDLKTGVMNYHSAGHDPIVVLSPGTKAIEDMRILNTQPSSPLGFSSVGSFESGSTQLSKGDRVLFYTDGIWDTDIAKRDFGGNSKRFMRNFIDLNRQHRDLRVLRDRIGQSILGDQKELGDDFTLLIAEFLGA